jgi:hypothetical protein
VAETDTEIDPERAFDIPVDEQGLTQPLIMYTTYTWKSAARAGR